MTLFSSDDIQVWHFDLDVPSEESDRLRQFLSGPEREREDRFHFERDRRRFAAAHGYLREILGAYLDRDPQAIRFDIAGSGKPRLASDQHSFLMFNLSHSHGRGVAAVWQGGDVGIDLELVRGDVNVQQLADRFFAPAERSDLQACAASEGPTRFFRYWVAKEAFLKYKGLGLQLPLGDCLVTLDADGARATIAWRRDRDDAEFGLVRFLPLSEGWVGAVSAQGTDWTVRLGEWPVP